MGVFLVGSARPQPGVREVPSTGLIVVSSGVNVRPEIGSRPLGTTFQLSGTAAIQ
jgi:hypothetical protein